MNLCYEPFCYYEPLIWTSWYESLIWTFDLNHCYDPFVWFLIVDLCDFIWVDIRLHAIVSFPYSISYFYAHYMFWLYVLELLASHGESMALPLMHRWYWHYLWRWGFVHSVPYYAIAIQAYIYYCICLLSLELCAYISVLKGAYGCILGTLFRFELGEWVCLCNTLHFTFGTSS